MESRAQQICESTTEVSASPAYVASSTQEGKIYKIPLPTVDNLYHTNVGLYPFGVATDPVQGSIYVANRGSNTITAFPGDINSTPITINVNEEPADLAVFYKYHYIFVAYKGEVELSIFRNSNGRISAMSPVLLVATQNGIAFNNYFKVESAYVALNSGKVAVINQVERYGDFELYDEIRTGGTPWGVACGQSSFNTWVTDIDGGQVFKIQAQHDQYPHGNPTNRLVQTIDVGSDSRPYGLAVNEEKKWLFVALSNNRTVRVINTDSGEFIKDIEVEDQPRCVAVDTVSNYTYVTNWGSSSVSVIDDNLEVTKNELVARNPLGIAFMGPNPM